MNPSTSLHVLEEHLHALEHEVQTMESTDPDDNYDDHYDDPPDDHENRDHLDDLHNPDHPDNPEDTVYLDDVVHHSEYLHPVDSPNHDDTRNLDRMRIFQIMRQTIPTQTMFSPIPEEAYLTHALQAIVDQFHKDIQTDCLRYSIPEHLHLEKYPEWNNFEIGNTNNRQLLTDASVSPPHSPPPPPPSPPPLPSTPPSPPLASSSNFPSIPTLPCTPPSLISTIQIFKGQLQETFRKLCFAEKNALDAVHKFEQMDQHRDRLNEFYEMIEDSEQEESFRTLLSSIYQRKLNHPATRECLRDYFCLVKQHLENIQQLRTLNTLHDAPLCPLCFTQPLSHAIIPCGHTFCVACLHRCDRCGVCRGDILSTQKIFIV